MSDLNHSLYADFPDYQERIHQLKISDEHFARLASEYHSLDHRVRGLEMSKVPVTDQAFNDLKLRRLQLKDQLFQRMQSI
jgi:uncharacterized protein YdcH (DUF465 family)